MTAQRFFLVCFLASLAWSIACASDDAAKKPDAPSGEASVGAVRITEDTFDTGCCTRRELDLNRDGKPDAYQFTKVIDSDPVVVRKEVDVNFDGKIDLVRDLNDKGIPVAGWHVGLAEWSLYPNMFTYRWGKAADLKKDGTNRNGKLFAALGASKIALVGINSQSSTVFMNQVADVVGHTPGLQMVYKTTAVTPDERDFTGIVQRIKALGDSPRPVGVQKLSGKERYRLRQGRYRILYTIEDRLLTVCVIRIADRKEVYRSL